MVLAITRKANDNSRCRITTNTSTNNNNNVTTILSYRKFLRNRYTKSVVSSNVNKLSILDDFVYGRTPQRVQININIKIRKKIKVISVNRHENNLNLPTQHFIFNEFSKLNCIIYNKISP